MGEWKQGNAVVVAAVVAAVVVAAVVGVVAFTERRSQNGRIEDAKWFSVKLEKPHRVETCAKFGI